MKTTTLKIKIGKLSIGHQQHISGTGVHGDKRLKRLKTRKNKNKKAIEEYDS